MSEAEERLLTRMKELAPKKGYTCQQWLQAVLDGMLHFDWDMAEKVTI